MKISDCLLDVPLSGLCKIDADKLCKCFGKSKIISKKDYRFVNSRLGIKITISEDDAQYIIRKLKLTPQTHPIFSLCTIYTA